MYLLFAGDFYYPGGGMNDLVGSFDSVEEAIEAGKQNEWYHVVQVMHGGFEVIERGRGEEREYE